MRGMRFPIGTLAILPMVLVMGCATSQTVHWQEDLAGAASRVADLSAEHKGEIKTLDGGHHWARNISLTSDSVRWTRITDGAPQGMPLADVASIEIVTRRHGKEGALIGGAIGIAVVASDILSCRDCGTLGSVNLLVYHGIRWGAAGALIGVLIGTSNADKIIFIPEDD